MSHTISEDKHYSAGESVTWEFTVEENDSAKDISGSTLEWYLVPSRVSPDNHAMATHDTTGVDLSFTSDGTDGRFDLTINQDTLTNEGDHWHRVVVDDSGSGKQVWGGDFPVDDI